MVIITGSSGCLSLSIDSSCRPSVPGMRISLMITSGCSEAMQLEQLVAVGKALIVDTGLVEGAFQHPADRAVIVHDPDPGLFRTACCCPIGRYRVKRCCRGAFALQQAAMVVDHDWAMASRPGALGTARDHGHENGVLDGGGYAGAVVDDIDLADQTVQLSAYGELAARACAQGDNAGAGVGCRLQRIAHDIQHRPGSSGRGQQRNSGRLGS